MPPGSAQVPPPDAKTQPLSSASMGGGEHERAPIYYFSRLNNLDYGGSSSGMRLFWDFNERIGTDENRFSFKSQGTSIRGRLKEADIQALYDRPVSEFFDLQLGVRQVLKPGSRTYFAIGIEGVAPYFFDTEATLFVSEKGQLSARAKAGLDVAIAPYIYIKPAYEIELFAANDRKTDQYTGGTGRLSLQTRYEISRRVAVYLEMGWERRFGQNGAKAKLGGERIDNLYSVVGLRFWY